MTGGGKRPSGNALTGFLNKSATRRLVASVGQTTPVQFYERQRRKGTSNRNSNHCACLAFLVVFLAVSLKGEKWL